MPIDGHLGCFCLLAIVNNAAMNRGIQASPQDPALVLLGMFPEVEFLDPKVILCLIF